VAAGRSSPDAAALLPHDAPPDPLAQQAVELAPTNPLGSSSRFGDSVALSADGSTAVVGAPGDGGNTGAVWIFTRSGGAWIQQAKLIPTDNIGQSGFGAAVSVSSDGSTIVIGGPQDGYVTNAVPPGQYTGAAWVYMRSGSNWAEQQKLVPPDESGLVRFGFSVALSADGSTVLVGAGDENTEVGAAWVFARSGATWSQQGPKLTGVGEVGAGEFGNSVALSADGNTAIVGGWDDDYNVGAVWPFVRTGATWARQGGKLIGGVSTPCGDSQLGQTWMFFGGGVSLSADGNTALIGSGGGEHLDSSCPGAAWEFTRSGPAWSQLGSKLTASDAAGASQFGESVALSADAGTAIVGGPGDASQDGAAWAFGSSGGTFSQLSAKTTANTIGGQFGYSVALSADASTALVGAFQDNSNAGSAWVYAALPSVSAVSPEIGPASGGTIVTITGTDLLGAASVHFGTQAATAVRAVSATEVTAVSPPQAPGTVDVTVTTGPGTSPLTATDRFVYEPPPTASVSSPHAGASYARGASLKARYACDDVDGPGIVSCRGTVADGAPFDTAASGRHTFAVTATDRDGTDASTTVSYQVLAPPALTRVREARARWREGPRLPHISAAQAPPIGTAFSFRLNERAEVKLVFKRRHGLGGGALEQSGHRGANRIVFEGRLTRRTTLAPGRYTAKLTATNAAGTRSKPATLAFTIAPG
jgi:hypothetical protein